MGAIVPDIRGKERPLAELAASQYGVVTRRQLLELGVRKSAIDHRLAVGRLHRIHHGVYALGHPRIDYRGRWMAAILAGGTGAVASHKMAAAILDLRRMSSARLEVTAPRTRHHVPGVIVHRPRSMHPDDVAVRDGFPVTSIPRTLLDLAGMLTPAEVERALEQAIRMQALDFRKLAELLDRSRARRGTKALRAIIAAHAPQSVYTRQELERRFWAFIVKLRFPRPQLNVWVAGYEVDAYWPEYGLIAELDGYETHGGLQAFENDHVKTAKLQLAGYTVVRVTWRMLHDDPGGVAALLQAHFARQAAAGARR